MNGRNREVKEQTCKMCSEKETTEHFIIECDQYNGQRKDLDVAVKIKGREEKEERRRGNRSVRSNK